MLKLLFSYLLLILSLSLTFLWNFNRNYWNYGRQDFAVLDSIPKALFQKEEKDFHITDLQNLTLITDTYKNVPNLQIFQKILIPGTLSTEGIVFQDIPAKSYKLKLDTKGLKYLHIFYDRNKQTLKIGLPSFEFQIEDKNYKTREIVFFESEKIAPEFTVKIGSRYVDLSNYQNDEYLEIENVERDLAQASLWQKSGDNLLPAEDASFENGLWTETPGDCSAILPGEPDFQTRLSKDSSTGKQSVLLGSKNHYACIAKSFNIDFLKDAIYQFSVDYKNLSGHIATYYIRGYNRRDIEDQDFDFLGNIDNIETQEWSTLSNFFSPKKEDTDTLIIFLYARSNGNSEVINLYDNLQVYKYEQKSDLVFRSVENLEKKFFELLDEELTVESDNLLLQVSNLSPNILPKTDSSFENGLWAETPSNCSAILPGEPKFEIRLVEDSTKDKQAMLLGSKSHHACVARTFEFPFKRHLNYIYSFDYKNLASPPASTYFYLRKRELFKGPNLQVNPFEMELITGGENNLEPAKDWQKYQELLPNTDKEMNTIGIFFYARSDGKTEVVNLYDNIQVQVFAPRFVNNFFLEYQQTKETNNKNLQAKIDYQDNWLDKKLTLVSNYPVNILLFKTKKDRETDLFSQNKKIASKIALFSERFPGGVNAWVLDCKELKCSRNSQGEYLLELTIRHQWNRLFNRLFLLSGLGILASVLYLIWSLIYKKETSFEKKVYYSE